MLNLLGLIVFAFLIIGAIVIAGVTRWRAVTDNLELPTVGDVLTSDILIRARRGQDYFRKHFGTD